LRTNFGYHAAERPNTEKRPTHTGIPERTDRKSEGIMGLRQKRPAIQAKETYYRIKRELQPESTDGKSEGVI